MRQAMMLVVLVLTLGTGSVAQPVTLEHLLEVERRCWGPAWVSSGFYDWRTVSRYRRHAGLHLGYDIAMPYGSPVAAAWPGTVTAVTPWTATEYGVTVRSEQGWEVTYGHISPKVAPGQRVDSGTVIGSIASDHVDVKMRDSRGNYIAFADSPPPEARPDPSIVRQAFARESQRVETLRLELERLRELCEASPQGATQRLKVGRSLAQKGLLSERDLQRLESDGERENQRAEALKRRDRLRQDLKIAERSLSTLIEQGRALGISLAVPAPAAPKAGQRDEPAPRNGDLQRLWTQGLISSRERAEAASQRVTR